MFSLQSPKQNRILAALPAEDYARLLPYLEFVSMPLGQTIYEPRAVVNHIYFPHERYCCAVVRIENGASVRLAIIGNEGLTGISSLLGGGGTPSGIVVQTAGSGYRIKANTLKKENSICGADYSTVILRYTQALPITQTSQNAVCNRRHITSTAVMSFSLDESRSDFRRRNADDTRADSRHVGGSAGKCDSGCSLKLQTIGAIQYSRGHITVVDREELENAVCECYTVVNDEYDPIHYNVDSDLCSGQTKAGQAQADNCRRVRRGEPRTAVGGNHSALP